MKHTFLTIAGASLTIGLAGCGNQAGPNTQRGAATGGLLGAGAGALIGHQSGRGVEGALIGGAAGATVGGLHGRSRDREQYGY